MKKIKRAVQYEPTKCNISGDKFQVLKIDVVICLIIATMVPNYKAQNCQGIR